MGKHRHVELSEQQRSELERMMRSGKAAARTLTRVRILLLSDRSQGQQRTLAEVAEAVMCSIGTVGNVCRRFLDEGMESAIYERERPGAVPKVTGEVEARLTMLACSTPPDGYSHWTLRLLAEQLIALDYIDSISHVTVGEVLKKTHWRRGG